MLAVMCSALACGGKAEDDGKPAEPSYGAPPANPTSPPLASPSRPSRPSPPVNAAPPQQPPPPPPSPFREAPQVDLAQAAAENVLAANCGQCHGPQLTPAQAQDGINYIDDTDKLVEVGLILPLDSTRSRIIEMMRDGSMPPVDSGLPRVTDADVELVASYIDNPRYWPGPVEANSVDAGIGSPSSDAGRDGGE